jgi:hypothetical protein
MKITSSTDLKKGVAFSGEELFLAYRIFKLGKTKTSKKEKKLSGPGMFESSIVEAKVQDYFFSFNHQKLLECMHPGNAPKNNDKLLECSKQYLVSLDVKNFKSQNFLGQALGDRFNIMNSSRTTFMFSNRVKNKIVSDNIEIFYYLTPTIIVGSLTLDKDNSKIKIIRATTKMKMLKNPKAAGW